MAKRAGWLGKAARFEEAIDRAQLVEPGYWGPEGLEDSYEQHGKEMGFGSKEEYEGHAVTFFHSNAWSNPTKVDPDTNAMYV